MEFFLIKALAFLRPVLSIHTGISFAGINVFELAAMFFSVMILAAFGIRAAVHKNLNLSATDLVVVGFIGWCIAIYLIYQDSARLNVLGKFIIPPLTYLVAKTAILDRDRYRDVLWMLILGCSIPLLLSTGLIALGGGLASVSYWTGIPRYEGVYYGSHDMGHNAAFVLMAAWTYHLMQRVAGRSWSEGSRGFRIIMAVLIAAAVFLLYMARVRTSILGLLVFGAVLLVFYYKRTWVLVAVVAAVGVGLIASDDLRRRFLPESVRAERLSDFDLMNYGSNRPFIWSRQISEFLDLSIDHQLAGIGIGNTLAEQTGKAGVLALDAHNDYLRVLVHTGVVGLVLLVALHLLILGRILRLEGSERWAFLALFLAVTAMNFVSNSYISRFGLAQMFYLVMAYVEVSGNATVHAPTTQQPTRVEALRSPAVKLAHGRNS